MSADASTHPAKFKPIVWDLKDDQREKLNGHDTGLLRGTSPSSVKQPVAARSARTRSQSPRQAAGNAGVPSPRGAGEDLRRGAERTAGRREEIDRRRGFGQDLRRQDPPPRQRYEGHSDRDPSASRRVDRFRSRDDDKVGLEPDLRTRATSWTRSDEGRARGHVAAADKDLVDLSYEEYLDVFGQVQDAWRKRKLELTFIQAQMPARP